MSACMNRAALLAAAALTTIGVSTAHAGVTNASASGYGTSADLSLLLLNLHVSPTAHASGTAPSPFLGSESAISLNASVAGLATLSTGILNGSVSSDVDGSAGSRTTSAYGSVDELTLSVLFGTVLSLNATTIASNAMASGDYGTLASTGSSVIEDLSLTVLGNTISVVVDAAPNTVLFDALGIQIVLNEQNSFGDGVTTTGMEVTALRVIFDDVAAGLGLLNGDLRFGYSRVDMTAVIPAPASAGAFTTLGVLAMRRRRPRG